MATLLPTFSVLVLHAATLTPSTVPARGSQEVLLTLDAPGALHLSARSDVGTSCEVIDRMSGPVAQGTNCELDLLLAAGQYKVRLQSPSNGTGQVKLSASAFTELNPSPRRLTQGSAVVTRLQPRQQATFWLSATSRLAPWVRVSGQHAGDVRLWRNGEWLEPMSWNHQIFSPVPGEPRHEWWFTSTLEVGEYALVIYGRRDSTTVTGTSTDDSLVVEAGFLPAPEERSVPFTLGPSGLFTVLLPASSLAAVLSLDGVATAPVTLQALMGGMQPRSECRLSPQTPKAECSVTSNGSPTELSVLAVRGPPGTHGLLEWADWRNDTSLYTGVGGYYGPTVSTYPFALSNGGQYLVGVHDVPNDTDAAPLGCQLSEINADGERLRVLARSAISIGAGERLERDFNFPNEGAVVWFDVGAGTLLQRAGLTSRRLRVSASGAGACEVYRVQGDGTLRRLTQTSDRCDQMLALDPGSYQLQLQPAPSAVRHLIIGEEGGSTLPQSGACTLPPQTLNASRYELSLNRLGDVTVRGLTVRSLPLGSAPTHFTLDAKQSLTLPITGGLQVRSRAGAAFGCTGQGGHAALRGNTCELDGTDEVVTVTNPGNTPLTLTVSRPGVLPVAASPANYSPAIIPLPKLTTDAPLWFDFAREQTWSVVFDVEAPGLYSATTLGLLQTRCSLRTTVNSDLASDQGGGRGRNCLVQTWLQKGRYLMTATTVGQSRGRGALVLSRHPAREFPGVTGEGEQFFRVDANELVQQKVSVRKNQVYQLSTTAQGVSELRCRLDDADGWPVTSVPTACTAHRELSPGTWLWTQLPLTVESMRHTSLVPNRDEVVFSGNATHPLSFFTWYRAELGDDGKDEFSFSLEGPTELELVLTGGMQGRVFVVEKDRAPRAVEVVPPQEVEPAAEQDTQAAPQEEPAEEPSDEAQESEAQDPAARPAEPVQARPVPPPPSGVHLSLPAGQYRLVTEHSRGDVGVSYRLHLGSVTLVPGMTRSLPVPSRVPISIPRDGTLRLRTSGDTDVRCRLFNAAGRLVLEGSENGADWNCALAEPITKGSYTLVLEAEAQTAGDTTLSLALPPSEDKGVLLDGAKAVLTSSIVSWSLPTPVQDVVQQVSLKAQGKVPLSCALEDPSGMVVERRTRVSECELLLRPGKGGWRVRAWSTDGTVPMQVGFSSRTVVESSAGQMPADRAFIVKLPDSGRYRTSTGVFCRPATEMGALIPCGPEVSLEAGPTVFAGLGSRSLSLEELTASPSASPVSLGLSRRPFLQKVVASTPSLFLLEARVQHGERVAPSCGFDGTGTVRERRTSSCFAASRVGTSALARVWAASEKDLQAQVIRSALVLPEPSAPLSFGSQHLALTTGTARLPLPRSRARLEMTLAQGAWAVLLDDTGAALELCAPTSTLRSCVLTGEGGSVAVFSGTQPQLDITTLRLEGTSQVSAFTGLFEDLERVAGTLRLTVSPTASERTLSIEGAQSCTLVFEDGARSQGCHVTVPANLGAEVVLEHGVGPLRAVLSSPGQERRATLAADLPLVPGAALLPATSTPLPAGRGDRTLVLEHEAVVRVSAEAGVCGLWRGADLLAVDGLGAGCELVRVLAPGTYRIFVRPFAARPLTGTLQWTAEPVTQLAEGVGTEQWLAPGQVRLFRFDTLGQGRIGLGLQSKSELLECALYDTSHQLIGQGCHQYLSLPRGHYLLTIRNAPSQGAVPIAFKPVLLGLSGDQHDIPEEYLGDFFHRVGLSP